VDTDVASRSVAMTHLLGERRRRRSRRRSWRVGRTRVAGMDRPALLDHDLTV
jgi:hypothetical protein